MFWFVLLLNIKTVLYNASFLKIFIEFVPMFIWIFPRPVKKEIILTKGSDHVNRKIRLNLGLYNPIYTMLIHSHCKKIGERKTTRDKKKCALSFRLVSA